MSTEDEDIFAVVRVPLWRKAAIAALFLLGVVAAGFYVFGPGAAQKAQQEKALEEIRIPTTP